MRGRRRSVSDFKFPLGDLPEDLVGRVAATLDRKSAVDLANTNASWSKPLKTLGCGFYKAEAPQGCERNVTHDRQLLNRALLCAVHNSKAKSLPGMPGCVDSSVGVFFGRSSRS